MALMPQHRNRIGVDSITLRATGDLRRIHLAWNPIGPPVEAYAVYAHAAHSADPARPVLWPESLLGTTREAAWMHDGLSPMGDTCDYVVIGLDAQERMVMRSPVVRAGSQPSVSVRGRAVVSLGRFGSSPAADALARFPYARYQSTFPNDVDVRCGVDAPATGWSWLHPGPEDAWAGRRPHRFRLRFDLPVAPSGSAHLAVWLADRHPTRAGAAGVVINGHRCEPLLFVDQPAPTWDGTVIPGHGGGPSCIERPLPPGSLRAGDNVLDIVKDQGSWIAYDALGIFTSPDR